jgi:nitrite reductase/ring-hydroxylating ferredoxin subunit
MAAGGAARGRRLCALGEIPEPGAKAFLLDPEGGDEVVVVRHDGGVYAYVNSCPHTGASLNWTPDQFLNLDRTLLQCATHDALFRIDDGLCVAGPCAGQGLRAVAVTVIGASVWLKGEADGGAVDG